jgi:hypothetical protein
MLYNFEWDPHKAKLSIRKHHRAFEQAAEVFRDPLALSVYDDEHSQSEDRMDYDGKKLFWKHPRCNAYVSGRGCGCSQNSRHFRKKGNA